MKLFKLPEKKFRVRVVYNSGYWRGRWNVQYAYYRWIPVWNTINTYGFFGWQDKWFITTKGVEDFANNLNSIEDVNCFHQQELDKHNKYLKENYPYKVKYIK